MTVFLPVLDSLVFTGWTTFNCPECGKDFEIDLNDVADINPIECPNCGATQYENEKIQQLVNKKREN